MQTWQKLLLRGAGFGAGFALATALIVSAAVWWSNRPPKPRPWNSKAISATFYSVDTEGPDNDVEFYYTIENNTDGDYHLAAESDVHLAALLQDEGELSFSKPEFLKMDLPLYVPAHNKVRATVHVAYPYPEKADQAASNDAKHDYNTRLAQFVTKEFSNLGGFVVLDDTFRYKIIMPNGWLAQGQRPLKVH